MLILESGLWDVTIYISSDTIRMGQTGLQYSQSICIDQGLARLYML